MLYQGERVKIQEKFKDGMKHGDKVSFFCKNKEKKCSYTEETQCIDGTLEIPKCFKGKIPMGSLLGISPWLSLSPVFMLSTDS